MKIIDLKSLSMLKSIPVSTLRTFLKDGMPHFRRARKIYVDSGEFDKWFSESFRVKSNQIADDFDEIIDFEGKVYHVQESFRRNSFGKPKGRKKRFVDLPSFLVQEFRDYIGFLKKDGMKNGRGTRVDYLFSDPDEKERKPYSQRITQGLVAR